nr:hypothetical protein [Planctomycetota bacterium]
CVSRSAGAAAGWRAACLWPLVPALAVFLPKADAVYPFIGMTVLACWHCPGPPGIGRAMIAGAVFWFGMKLSLAMLPVAVLASLLSVQAIAVAESSTRRRVILLTLRDATVVAMVFATLTAIVYVWADVDLLAVWRWNLRNHAAFYESSARTYWKWLLVNPIELAFATGLPIAVCLVFACRRVPSLTSTIWPVGIVVALLWLSGKNSGEAARLWMFLIPWYLWVAAGGWEGAVGASRWRAILSLQVTVAGLTAIRVSGFAFAEMIDGSG